MITEYLRTAPETVLVGQLRRDYILPLELPPSLDILGGNLAYAAAALASWGGKAGLLSRVAADFPLDWLDRFEALGFFLEGVRPVSEPIPPLFFVEYGEGNKPSFDNPITHFAERQLPFPPELIGYQPRQKHCSKVDYQAESFRVTDMPRSYLEAGAAHICPIDYISHKTLPSVLKGGMVHTVTMRACSCYMDPIFWEDIRGLITDLTAFMMTDIQALKLFQGRSMDLWEIADHLANYGPEVILIQTRDETTYIYDRMRHKRWIIPAYRAKINDPTGMLDAFDGGFLAGLQKSHDPLEAGLYGSISAAVAGEGSGPFFLLECLPGLKEMRLDVLRQQIIEV